MPKSEVRNPKEIRSPIRRQQNAKKSRFESTLINPPRYYVAASVFGLHSAFGFQHSDLSTDILTVG
ncbi:MAG TPA: hypothetical protein VGI88_14450 [Verrucomicrobiae bacterium]|jgi:hypothetical protein